LAEETFLEDDFLRELMSVGEVDLLVGIPSYNNAATMDRTVEVIEESFQQNFVRDRVVILNVDGGSSDGTRNVLLRRNDRKNGSHRGLTSLRTVHRVSWAYGSSPSSGMGLRTILAAADLLRAKSCAVVSPTTANLTPSWVANLLRPIYRERFDFVAPLYARNKFQGLLARNLLYPMSRAVFGYRIRELYSDEWGFSGRLASQCLDQDVWHEEAVRTRPEAWMGVSAISAELNCCQYFLGQKSAPASGTGPDIVEAIRQAVGSLFWCLEKYESLWFGRTGSQTIPTFGSDHELSEESPPANQEKIFEMFRSGVNELEPLLASILTSETHAQVKAIARLDSDRFRFSNELWVRTLYDFAASYHHAVLNRDHLVQSVVPLYRGMLYSFLVQHANSSADEMEADAEQLGLEFERQKPYLVERWKGAKLR
jgi:glucosylglycerate synthase